MRPQDQSYKSASKLERGRLKPLPHALRQPRKHLLQAGCIVAEKRMNYLGVFKQTM